MRIRVSHFVISNHESRFFVSLVQGFGRHSNTTGSVTLEPWKGSSWPAPGSRIENEFQEGTMERWLVPCPSCGHEQVLSYCRLTNHADPRHRCEECGNDEHDQADWIAASQNGLWIPTRTHDKHGAELTTRGFELNCLPSPWWSWTELRNEHGAAKRLMEQHQDASKMVTFKKVFADNTVWSAETP
jgi:phage terminase large subunit GpA-like protein